MLWIGCCGLPLHALHVIILFIIIYSSKVWIRIDAATCGQDGHKRWRGPLPRTSSQRLEADKARTQEPNGKVNPSHCRGAPGSKVAAVSCPSLTATQADAPPGS